MKKFITSVFVALLLLVSGATPANADERAFQWGSADKQTPSGIPTNFDITSASMGITSDNKFQIYVTTKGIVDASIMNETSKYILELDVNLDKVTDYTISSFGILDVTYLKTRKILKNDGTDLTTCEAQVGATSNRKDFLWQLTSDCLQPRETLNIAITATGDGIKLDRYPDGTAWWSVKTNFLKAQPCSSALNGTKRTHLSKTYICMKSGSSWKWLDWGPIAASKTKYLTEKAFYICNLGAKAGALLEDGGKTLSLDGVYKYVLTESVFNCVTKTMGVPSSVLRKIAITRALDGTLESKFGNVNLFWNYHPDNGLNITFSYN